MIMRSLNSSNSTRMATETVLSHTATPTVMESNLEDGLTSKGSNIRSSRKANHHKWCKKELKSWRALDLFGPVGIEQHESIFFQLLLLKKKKIVVLVELLGGIFLIIFICCAAVLHWKAISSPSTYWHCNIFIADSRSILLLLITYIEQHDTFLSLLLS